MTLLVALVVALKFRMIIEWSTGEDVDGYSWCNLRYDFDFWKNCRPCTTLGLFCMAVCSGEITIIPVCC